MAAATRATLARDFGAQHPSALSAHMHLGAALAAQGHHARAVELLRTTHAEQIAAHGKPEHPDCLETAWRLGSLLAVAGTPASDAGAAVTLLRSTADHQAAMLGGEHPRTLRTLVKLAEALLATRAEGGEAAEAAQDEASRLLQRAAPAQRAVLDSGHPDLEKTRALVAAFGGMEIQ